MEYWDVPWTIHHYYIYICAFICVYGIRATRKNVTTHVENCLSLSLPVSHRWDRGRPPPRNRTGRLFPKVSSLPSPSRPFLPFRMGRLPRRARQLIAFVRDLITTDAKGERRLTQWLPCTWRRDERSRLPSRRGLADPSLPRPVDRREIPRSIFNYPNDPLPSSLPRQPGDCSVPQASYAIHHHSSLLLFREVAGARARVCVVGPSFENGDIDQSSTNRTSPKRLRAADKHGRLKNPSSERTPEEIFDRI